MAKMDENYNIETTRGDVLSFNVKTINKNDNTPYVFQVGDVIRFKIMEANNCEQILVQKDVIVSEISKSVLLTIPSDEMKIGNIINTPVDYWYEVELNPDTDSRITILGYISGYIYRKTFIFSIFLIFFSSSAPDLRPAPPLFPL